MVGTPTETKKIEVGGATGPKTTKSVLNLLSVRCYGTTKRKGCQAVRSIGLELGVMGYFEILNLAGCFLLQVAYNPTLKKKKGSKEVISCNKGPEIGRLMLVDSKAQ